MKILVDADACPVKVQIVNVAREMNLHVIMFIDTSHILTDSYAEIVTVDRGRDSVDFALTNIIERGDIVVTQDYGVAAMALAKEARVINQNGFIYSEKNIDQLLFERELSRRMRAAGRQSSKHKKRNKKDDREFEIKLRKLLDQLQNK